MSKVIEGGYFNFKNSNEEAELKTKEVTDLQFTILKNENKVLQEELEKFKNKNNLIIENEKLKSKLEQKTVKNIELEQKIKDLENKLQKYKELSENKDKDINFGY